MWANAQDEILTTSTCTCTCTCTFCHLLPWLKYLYKPPHVECVVFSRSVFPSCVRSLTVVPTYPLSRQVKIPSCSLYHYDVTITPDKCPRRVNREIIEVLVNTHKEYFGQQKPVFDGRKNLYSRKALPIGRDRVSGYTCLLRPYFLSQVALVNVCGCVVFVSFLCAYHFFLS